MAAIGFAGSNSMMIFDNLMGYLRSPLFQVPVMTFIDSKCIVFEPTTDDCHEYRQLFEEYKIMITQLLDAYRQDSGLNQEQIIRGLTELNSRISNQPFFQGILEQIIASENFQVFVKMMTQHNIQIQQQALLLILQQTGSVPDSLLPNPAEHTSQYEDDEAILIAVLKLSQAEYDEEQSKKKKNLTEADTYQINEAVSKLKIEGKKHSEKLNEAVRNVAFDEKDSIRTASGGGDQKSADKVQLSTTALVSKPPPDGTDSASAANAWLQTAFKEVDANKSSSPMTVEVSTASGDQLEERRKFLLEQREKLIKLKKNQREAQLNDATAEKSNLSRPKSAMMARNAISGKRGEVDDGKKAVDSKTLEMRKAIAAKLRNEVVRQ